ncbi:hypothetical protein BdWA1_002121 [Babesia duncani]|uniref:Uncharacterized protein n=1 Tax=Babesia duncani TaxID=323732 RepID=A0AAD9UPG9_9APIC|nr:hypothetical protein BdWA1_002121 [Babesia duncani]
MERHNAKFLGFLNAQNSSLNRNTNLRMIWGYPLLDDGPNRGPRRKVNQAFERGPMRTNASFNYEYANRLAQNCYYVPGEGRLPFYPEEGLGKTEDVHTCPETACGQIDIDPVEFEKIKHVYTTFNDRGCGVLRIIGAKCGHFAFSYSGPMKDKYGIKSWLRILINRSYPGAKVTLITENETDTPFAVGVDERLYSKQRRLMQTGRDYCESFQDGLPTEDAIPRKFDMLI